MTAPRRQRVDRAHRLDRRIMAPLMALMHDGSAGVVLTIGAAGELLVEAHGPDGELEGQAVLPTVADPILSETLYNLADRLRGFPPA